MDSWLFRQFRGLASPPLVPELTRDHGAAGERDKRELLETSTLPRQYAHMAAFCGAAAECRGRRVFVGSANTPWYLFHCVTISIVGAITIFGEFWVELVSSHFNDPQPTMVEISLPARQVI